MGITYGQNVTRTLACGSERHESDTSSHGAYLNGLTESKFGEAEVQVTKPFCWLDSRIAFVQLLERPKDGGGFILESLVSEKNRQHTAYPCTIAGAGETRMRKPSLGYHKGKFRALT